MRIKNTSILIFHCYLVGTLLRRLYMHQSYLICCIFVNVFAWLSFMSKGFYCKSKNICFICTPQA